VISLVDLRTSARPSATWSRGLGIGCLLVGLVLSGCSWRGGSLGRPRGPQAPVVLQPGVTAQQIVAAVNQNTARVQTYVSYNARFSVPGLSAIPLMQGNIALERPLKFRLQAGTAVTGSEIDLGSNPELFWFWVRHNNPPALYFCRHDQYATSAAPQMLPVDPNWIGDALGLVELNPSASYEGPFPRSDGSLELRSTISTPSGPMTRVVVVDKERAWVLEQHLYDSASTPVASAVAENFVYDPVAMVSLPRRVTMRVPQADMALTVDIGQLSVNVPTGDEAQLFTMPVMESYPRVDLGTTTPGAPVAQSHVPATPTTSAYAAPPSFPAVTPAQVVPGPITPTVSRLPAGGVTMSP
jgi:hypothetical protein